MPKPARNPRYLAWLRKQVCYACKAPYPEAAHIGLSTSRRGLGQKYPDLHRGPRTSIHTVGPEKFFAMVDGGRDRVIEKYNAEYQRKEGANLK